MADELDARQPEDATEIIFNAKKNKPKTVQEWLRQFPSGGTASNPTVVRVTEYGLSIPDGVSLSNYIIIVENKDIKFKGNNHSLDNVVLITEDGKIDLNQTLVKDSAILAASEIKMHGKVKFAGQTKLANGKDKITIKGSTQTSGDKDLLTVIAADDLKVYGNSHLVANLLTAGKFELGGNSTLMGSVGAKGDIKINSASNVSSIF